MTHITDEPNNNATPSWKALLPLLALLLVLSHAQQASAQWSSPDTAGNTSSTGAGRVGVGVTTPSKGKLDVRLDEGVADGEHGIIYASRPDMTGGVFMGYRANGTAPTGGYLRSTASLPLFFGTQSTPEAMTITNTGDIGIGGAPFKGARFEVRADQGVAAGEHGLIYASRSGQGTGGVFMGYRANGTAATGGYLRGISNLPLFVGTTASPEAMTIADNGSVGIGVTAPTQALHVKGTGLIQNTGAAGSFITDRTDGKIAAFGVGGVSTTIAYDDTGIFKIESNTRATIALGGFGSGANRFTINGAGNVGVGTATPVSKLHVAGDITVDGNINAKYQDVAEWVPSTQKLAVGTVVIVDGGGVNHVLASTSAYDTSVAGVITGQPGLLLGEAGEGKVKVATTGRVKVRVDATRAPIRAGDLLVTSGVAGVAMRSEPVSVGGVTMHRPGTLIGKALESLDKGTGEILVLLSLQ